MIEREFFKTKLLQLGRPPLCRERIILFFSEGSPYALGGLLLRRKMRPYIAIFKAGLIAADMPEAAQTKWKTWFPRSNANHFYENPKNTGAIAPASLTFRMYN